jgi:protein-serine/threonine kinase
MLTASWGHTITWPPKSSKANPTTQRPIGTHLHYLHFNAKLDVDVSRWSLGIILFECLFGYPPFWASTRRATQKVIMDWMHTLDIPSEPGTSVPVKQLIRALLTNASSRLRTPTWEIDLVAAQGQPITAFQRMQVFKRDVRNHPFFRGAKVDFERVHLEKAPWIPGMVGMSREGGEPGGAAGTEKPIKTKDVMLLDERVLKERSRSAFKNFTYRGPDLGGVLKRFADALQEDEVE